MTAFIEQLLDVVITSTSRTVTRTGFGTPLIAAYHAHYVDRVREYTDLAGMVDDGFTTTEPAYLMATAIFAQALSPPSIKVGRRALAFNQVVRLTPQSPPDVGTVYSVAVNGTTVTYTSIMYDTLADVCTALAALIDALPLVTASGVSGTWITVTTTLAGSLASFGSLTDTLTLADQTVNPGVETDLAAILVADSDWYGLLLDSNSPAEITAAATWTEAAKKLFFAQTADGLCLSSGSITDIAYTTKAAGFTRTAVWYYPGINLALGQLASGVFGARLPTDPGTENWAYVQLSGVTVYALTDTQRAALLAKNGNVYILADSENAITYAGKVAEGEWIDTIRGIDALTAGIREDQFALILAQAPGKLPFSDNGIDAVRSTLKGTLKRFTSTATVPRLLDADPVPTIYAPRVADVSAANRALRTLPGVTFSAKLGGAINTLTVRGTVYS